MLKRSLTFLLTTVVLGSGAQAATVTMSNVVGEFNPIVLPNGTAVPFGTGIVTTGIFPDDDITAASVGTDFIPLNPDAGFALGFDQGGGNTIDGLYQGSINSADDLTAENDPNGFIGSNIYTVIGNASTVAASSAFLVVKMTTMFAADPAGGGDAFLDNTVAMSNILVGDFGQVMADIGLGNADAFRMAAVPEPATNALLFGLLACGFVWIRRRKR